VSKRGYFVHEADENTGIAVVANSITHAKQLCAGELDCEWIDIRVNWKRSVNVSDLPVGIIKDDLLALRRGLYDWSEDTVCDICGLSTHVNVENGVIICGACENECLLGLQLEVLEMEAKQ